MHNSKYQISTEIPIWAQLLVSLGYEERKKMEQVIGQTCLKYSEWKNISHKKCTAQSAYSSTPSLRTCDMQATQFLLQASDSHTAILTLACKFSSSQQIRLLELDDLSKSLQVQSPELTAGPNTI